MGGRITHNLLCTIQLNPFQLRDFEGREGQCGLHQVVGRAEAAKGFW